MAISSRLSSLDPRPSSLATNLERLRAILPKCDVLLVTTTQQNYRSARVGQDSAPRRAAQLVFVQTLQIETTFRVGLAQGVGRTREAGRVFFVDSLSELADAQAGLQPRGDLPPCWIN